MYKNELINSAFQRVLKEETGLSAEGFYDLKFIGLFEHFYEDNVYNEKDFNTHYLIYAMKMKLKANHVLDLSQQHSESKFVSEKCICNSSEIHDYTKNYFIENPSNKFSF